MPAFESFAEAYSEERACLVRTTLIGDLLTPVAAFLKLRQVASGPAFLLESVEGGGAISGRTPAHVEMTSARVI